MMLRVACCLKLWPFARDCRASLVLLGGLCCRSVKLCVFWVCTMLAAREMGVVEDGATEVVEQVVAGALAVM